jgi:rod shape-determining protein MreC
MLSRKRNSSWFRVTAIIVLLAGLVFLISRLDFPGWMLRGLSGLIPQRPAEQYTPEEIRDLQSKIDNLQQQNTYLNELILEMQRSAGMTEIASTIPYDLIGAKVIYRDHARLFDTAIIDKGSYDGIEVDMPVVDSKGLVGRIVATTGAVSRISLLTSPDCSFGVIDQRSRDLGIIHGGEPIRWNTRNNPGDEVPPDILQLAYLSPSAQISVQDILITSGLSGITPPGLRVGEVVEIISREEEGSYDIRVRPYADFEHLEELSVVLYKENQIQDINQLLNITGPVGEPSVTNSSQ